MIIDNFLDDYESFREYCDYVDYSGETNPVDGVFYPNVSTCIPEEIKLEVHKKLSEVMEYPVNINAIFLRQSPKGVYCPHQAHTDDSMGAYSFMLYLNKEEDCKGGTSFLKHKKFGWTRNTLSDEEVALWKEDTNTPEVWAIEDMCSMKSNRACIFDASLFHRAEPVGGFGKDNESRLVLTAFYD